MRGYISFTQISVMLCLCDDVVGWNSTSTPPTPEPNPPGDIDFVMPYGFAGAMCPFADRIESGACVCGRAVLSFFI